jgi:hypothetical protein
MKPGAKAGLSAVVNHSTVRYPIPMAEEGQQTYKGWRSIPIQHQELDPDFQVVPQSSVSAYLGESPAPARLAPRPEPRTLDGDMLLDACNENFPGDVYGAKLTGKEIEAIATEDAPFFLSLARLDLSDNRCAPAQGPFVLRPVTPAPGPAPPHQRQPPTSSVSDPAHSQYPRASPPAPPRVRWCLQGAVRAAGSLPGAARRVAAVQRAAAPVQSGRLRGARGPPPFHRQLHSVERAGVRVIVIAAPLPRRQVLDLSVNAIGVEDIGALAELPCLKELDISR